MAEPTKRPLKRRIAADDPDAVEVSPDDAAPVGDADGPGDEVVDAADDEASETDEASEPADEPSLIRREVAKPRSKAADGEAKSSSGGKGSKKGDEPASTRTPREAVKKIPKKEQRGGPSASSRYTPPTARPEDLPSPMWVPVLMFTLFALGGLAIFLNYVGLLPGATSNWYLLLGLGFILGGIITATQYR